MEDDNAASVFSTVCEACCGGLCTGVAVAMLRIEARHVHCNCIRNNKIERVSGGESAGHQAARLFGKRSSSDVKLPAIVRVSHLVSRVSQLGPRVSQVSQQVRALFAYVFVCLRTCHEESSRSSSINGKLAITDSI